MSRFLRAKSKVLVSNPVGREKKLNCERYPTLIGEAFKWETLERRLFVFFLQKMKNCHKVDLSKNPDSNPCTEIFI